MTLILVVDDEAQIRKFLRISLAANGYRVVEADSARAGLKVLEEMAPGLLILDLGLPDLDGQEMISKVRSTSEIPIVVLSVRADEMDKVEALDRGANDYVAKPFGVGELMARVRAVLRPRSPREEILEVGNLRIDLPRRTACLRDMEVHLSRKEWDLLVFLARKPDHVLTHKHILREVWGPAHLEDTAYLRVYINQLRQKLEDDPARPSLIVTEPGVGYRLKPGD